MGVHTGNSWLKQLSFNVLMYNLWLFIDGNGAKLPTDTGVKNHQLCCRHKKSSDKASWENRQKKYEHFGSGQKASNLKM